MTIMIFSEFNMFKDLEQLQINDCQTDICLVGAGGVKVFNQRTAHYVVCRPCACPA